MEHKKIEPGAPEESTSPLILEVGKRYVALSGAITGALEKDCEGDFVFDGCEWDPSGTPLYPSRANPVFGRLIREYVEPAPALVTIEGPGPLAPIAGPIDWTRPVRCIGSHGIKHAVRIIAIDHSLIRPVIGVMIESGMRREVSSWHYNGQYDDRTPGTCLDLENVPVASKWPPTPDQGYQEATAEAHRPSERCPRWSCYKEAYYLGGRLISCTDSECVNYDKDFMKAVAA